MGVPKRALYVRQAPYPWDIRVDKFCTSLHQHGWEVEIVARRGSDQDSVAETDGMGIHRVGPQRPRWISLPVPGNPLWQSLLDARVKAFKPDLPEGITGYRQRDPARALRTYPVD